ncbi:chaplin [Streptomyces sp. NBC_01443]|nr:chaplin [Streptomyces sp. NBC_01443]
MRGATMAVAGTAVLMGGAGLASADDATAGGVAAQSPGVGSGNQLSVPIAIPINICGNTVNVAALLNPAFGNVCLNH